MINLTGCKIIYLFYGCVDLINVLIGPNIMWVITTPYLMVLKNNFWGVYVNQQP